MGRWGWHARGLAADRRGHGVDRTGWTPRWVRRRVTRPQIYGLGALLVGAPCAGLRPEALVDDAWEGLSTAHGHLSLPAEGKTSPEAAAHREREFADYYHTTVVTLMASLLETEGPFARRTSGGGAEAVR